MPVAVDTEAPAGAVASAVEDMQVSAGADAQVLVAVLAATVELESAEELVPMPQDLFHLEFQRDGMAGTGKSTTHHEHRPGGRFIVLLRVCKIKPVQGSLIGRRNIPVAITFRQIDPGQVLHVSPLSSRVIMLGQIGTYASSAPAQLQGVQRSLAKIGLDRI
jgi:hypothetical protein